MLNRQCCERDDCRHAEKTRLSGKLLIRRNRTSPQSAFPRNSTSAITAVNQACGSCLTRNVRSFSLRPSARAIASKFLEGKECQIRHSQVQIPFQENLSTFRRARPMPRCAPFPGFSAGFRWAASCRWDRDGREAWSTRLASRGLACWA